MNETKLEQFAASWIDAWNSHDMDKIMDLYTDDFEISSPKIKSIMGVDSGILCGKPAVGEYWRKALQLIPDLHFDLIDFTSGNHSIALYYHSVNKQKSIEVMFFDANGKINKVFAHYTP